MGFSSLSDNASDATFFRSNTLNVALVEHLRFSLCAPTAAGPDNSALTFAPERALNAVGHSFLYVFLTVDDGVYVLFLWPCSQNLQVAFFISHLKDIMAYAAYRDSFGANSFTALPAQPVLPNRLMVLDLTVPSCEAFRVRRLLARCSLTGVLRCVPKPHDRSVLLEVQLPGDRVQDVLHLLMDQIPSGELGALKSWQGYLTAHGIAHGF